MLNSLHMISNLILAMLGVVTVVDNLQLNNQKLKGLIKLFKKAEIKNGKASI